MRVKEKFIVGVQKWTPYEHWICKTASNTCTVHIFGCMLQQLIFKYNAHVGKTEILQVSNTKDLLFMSTQVQFDMQQALMYAKTSSLGFFITIITKFVMQKLQRYTRANQLNSPQHAKKSTPIKKGLNTHTSIKLSRKLKNYY